ncbi:beta-carotene hydroxylase 2, chloroplastic isoform X3 [Cucumis melo]|uniref:beta-carotene 3-hydroxylase n=1 Tax=Cucumis melo TaxID=3656 RepID=A0A1S4DS92_CUCME|nr:beta-carotene hydroxylase 2, chloroplastic isoform X3 [Cucumis melo]
MATVISAVATAGQYRYDYGRLFQRPAGAPSRGFPWRCFAKQRWRRLMVMKMKKKKSEEDEMVKKLKMSVEEKMRKKKAEREGYLIAAIVSSFGITSMAAIAVYYRFSSQIMEVGMEFWARWAHKELWHASLWDMHESHHKPRVGAFEKNDVFAIINAIPAIALLSFGLFNHGFFPGLCFGAGLGITVFGMAYMFVHDGLVHRRFPVGPIAAVPYLRRVAAAHHIHHTDKFDGVPYGLFLGPKELEEVDGEEELQKEIRRRNVYRN